MGQGLEGAAHRRRAQSFSRTHCVQAGLNPLAAALTRKGPHHPDDDLDEDDQYRFSFLPLSSVARDVKTSMCRLILAELRTCYMGSSCRFAHTPEELRASITPRVVSAMDPPPPTPEGQVPRQGVWASVRSPTVPGATEVQQVEVLHRRASVHVVDLRGNNVPRPYTSCPDCGGRRDKGTHGCWARTLVAGNHIRTCPVCKAKVGDAYNAPFFFTAPTADGVG